MLSNLFKILVSPIVFIQNYFKTVVFLTILYFIFSNSDTSTLEKANLAKIDLYGPIMDVELVLEQIETVKKDSEIKGVLFNVNSPGGAVAPSVELSYAIKELKELKPVVAYASGIMASGSYYASIWADKIIANPGSMVGSIGVIFQGANVEELISKIGIKTQTVKVGRYKEAGTPTREWTDYEKDELNSVINDTYNMFINDVSSARNLDVKNHKDFADAHIFTASQSLKVGLIDDVGNISYAKNELYKLSGVLNPIWKKEDKMDKLLEKVIRESISSFSILFMDGLKAY